MPDHSFNPVIAEKYGTDAAIFLQNIWFWIKRNKAYKQNFFEGKYWTFNSMDAFREVHPYWSRRQIERIIGTCRKEGLLLSGCFNEDRRDRTCWYTLSEKILAFFDGETGLPKAGEEPESDGNVTTDSAACISPNGEMHFTERGSACHQTVKSIYRSDIKQTDKKHIPPIVPHEVFEICAKYSGDDAELQDAILGLLENRAKANKSPVKTTRAMNGILTKLDKLSGGNRELKLALLEKATVSNWLTVFSLKPDEMPASGAEGEEGVTYI